MGQAVAQLNCSPSGLLLVSPPRVRVSRGSRARWLAHSVTRCLAQLLAGARVAGPVLQFVPMVSWPLPEGPGGSGTEAVLWQEDQPLG